MIWIKAVDVEAVKQMSKTIDIKKSVYERNEKLAAELNKTLSKKAVFCINILGAPGVGKTTSLLQILKKLDSPACVIEGDLESDIDTQKLKALGFPAVQINTGNACHLDAPIVEEAFAKLSFSNGFLFIENIGNLVCPAEYMIGEHIKLLICAITDGSDKPYKYPIAFEKADIILLNKCDLINYINFDIDFFNAGVSKLNPKAPIFIVSGETGEGFDEVVKWLQDNAKLIIA